MTSLKKEIAEKWTQLHKLDTLQQQTVLLSTNEKNRDKLWEVCKPRVDFRIFVGKNGSFHPDKYRPGDKASKDIMRYLYHNSPEKKTVNKATFTEEQYLAQPVCTKC